ncbi:GspE/PulE family protein [Chitinilyticum aquatile]|uniref:GspE/PulE family protein n=1 Tax=Chitinilyticum aquatile TaxID=362520 RepID=UPI00041904DD|nr:GspE/PulE family protein [Chitinilyticum aquatile]
MSVVLDGAQLRWQPAGDYLLVTACEGFDPRELDVLAARHGLPVRLQAVLPAAEFAALAHSVDAALPELAGLPDNPDEEGQAALDDNSPMARYVADLLARASAERASDVHVEPYESGTVIRLRVDGQLRELATLRRSAHAGLLSRLKIMAELDIAERRLPQDGRILLRESRLNLDIRLSTLPTAHGERAVMRLLDPAQERRGLDAVGIPADILTALAQALDRPHGLLLVTGPTGSGKTTTLYAALAGLDVGARNIMTVEDPVEYDLPGIAQTAVMPRIDMSFARALRAILRQDPDVVMIGEIRDRETAQIAVQASLTGHLVLATLHTNTAVGAISRLLDMGVEPFLLASSLTGVLAQRLVRRNCPACAAPDPLFAGGQRGRGCPECRQTGYRGRVGVYEWLGLDAGLRRMIHDGRSDDDMLAHARQQLQMRTLAEQAAVLVAQGVTAREEVLRVTGMQED